MNEENRQISRRTGVVSFFTLLSRILGLVRDAVLAFAFGASYVADAFYVAFRIPNLLRRFVAEGALTAAFVPLYTEYLKRSRSEAKAIANIVFTHLLLLLVVLVIVGIIFAPWLVKLIAWGFADDPQQFALTVFLTRLMFPYIFLISLVALAMGVLNSLKHFAAPAASPILLNLGIIFGAVGLKYFFELPVVAVAVGVLLGGFLQLALQIPVLMKEGMFPSFNFNFRDPGLKRLLFLMGPSAFGAAVYQVNVLFVTLLASFLPTGSVSYLWYADRVSEFPLGVFAIAVATASLPTLSAFAAEKNMEAFRNVLSYSLHLTFLIAIPASVGLLLLAHPVVQLLFQRGAFTPAMTEATALALMVFALKIPFVAAVRNVVPAFYALKDTKTPVVVAMVDVIVNLLCGLFLMKHFAHVGLSMALVISAIVNFLLLCALLRRKQIHRAPINYRGLTRICIASAAMAVVVGIMRMLLTGMFAAGKIQAMLALLLIIILAVFVYLTTTYFLHKEDFKSLIHMFGRKRRA
ncbi:MAG: murein biosynthesis integral membrane protein MurJ [Deltaproteobacteria bacterium CG_4_10_14_0_2_um_filter_43_8]|nr:MAG: murein biosynthesis integral membrane protein MurJ [Deltaproteobacteria bacterium CG_4_10_14_0_2_um_filter_43_8]